jgi:hypothetical protein
VALIAGVTACAGTGTRMASRGSTATVGSDFSTHKNDRDNDGDQNDDDGKVLGYGHAADAADRRTSIGLVTRYFAAAAAEDGAKACASLVPFIAESVPEDDGHQPGLRGKTCAVVMSKLFKVHHQLLTMKSATLRVIGVRVEGDKALAILEFPTIPEVRQITERRVGSAWRLLDLFDGILE